MKLSSSDLVGLEQFVLASLESDYDCNSEQDDNQEDKSMPGAGEIVAINTLPLRTQSSSFARLPK